MRGTTFAEITYLCEEQQAPKAQEQIETPFALCCHCLTKCAQKLLCFPSLLFD